MKEPTTTKARHFVTLAGEVRERVMRVAAKEERSVNQTVHILCREALDARKNKE